jgi:hypothetical protein
MKADQILRCLMPYAPLLVLDLVSSFLAIQRIVKGRGRSGLPFVTLILYLCILVVIRLPGVPVSAKVLAFLSAASMHVALIFGLPHLVRSYLKKR